MWRTHKTSALLVLSAGNVWYNVWIRCVRQEMSVLWSFLVRHASLTYRSHPICSVTVISCRASCYMSAYLHAPTHQVKGKKETERTTTSLLCLHHVEGEQTDLWSGSTSHDYNKAVMVNTSSQFLGAPDSWHRLQVLFCLFMLVLVCLKLVISSIPLTLADNLPDQTVIDEVVFLWWTSTSKGAKLCFFNFIFRFPLYNCTLFICTCWCYLAPSHWINSYYQICLQSTGWMHRLTLIVWNTMTLTNDKPTHTVVKLWPNKPRMRQHVIH